MDDVVIDHAVVEAVGGLGEMTPLEYTRRARGLTQRELEQAVGIGEGTLSQVENRWRRLGPVTRAKLAVALGVDEAILFPAAQRRL
jgi:transcriptional regulator with XRE-family HTH domain